MSKALQIKAKNKRGIFHRCGFQFTKEAKTIPVADLSTDQIERLKAEPKLSVKEVDVAKAKPAAPKKAPAKKATAKPAGTNAKKVPAKTAAAKPAPAKKAASKKAAK